jgi:hypothetical protein
VGTARNYLAAAGYGTDKGIFGYGNTGSAVSLTNLVSNSGVVATDVLESVLQDNIQQQLLMVLLVQAIFGYGITGVACNDQFSFKCLESLQQTLQVLEQVQIWFRLCKLWYR